MTMEKPRKKELLDCPFCGNKALTKIEQPRMDSDNVPKYCKCSYGPCCASKIYWPIEQWNVRSMSTWLEGEVPTSLEIEKVVNDVFLLSRMNKDDNWCKNVAKAIHALITRKLTEK